VTDDGGTSLRCRTVRMAALLLGVAALGVAAALPLSGCGDGGATAPPPSPTWTPAPRVTAGPQSFDWASPTRLRGKLLLDAWTSTASLTLPAGPATVVGILKVPGSTAPRFTARLQPVPQPTSFAGYGLTGASLWHLPNIRQGEGALAGWFPYVLPAGSYRLLVRETSGGGYGGSYDLNVAGVK
jgi:hypothetical protein